MQRYDAAQIPDICNAMGFCGFGFSKTKDLRQTPQCWLYPKWAALNASVPGSAQDAICIPAGVPKGTDCPL
jgi:hypothetical protein